MNLIADLVSSKLTEKGIQVFRNDYLSSYNNSLKECVDNNIDLLISLESTSSVNHDKTGLETLITNESSNSFGLAKLINRNLNSLKSTKMIYTNDIKGSNTKEEGNVSSLMIELGYHDNSEDANWIVNNRESIAETIANSIINYYGMN